MIEAYENRFKEDELMKKPMKHENLDMVDKAIIQILKRGNGLHGATCDELIKEKKFSKTITQRRITRKPDTIR